jgi:hypothetical protein
VKGAETPFYSPHREFACWGVRDPDMSDRGTGQVQKMSPESSLSTGQAWCTRTYSLRNKLTRNVRSSGQTCPKKISRIWRIN